MKNFYSLFLLIYSVTANADTLFGKNGQLNLELEKEYKLYRNFLGLPYVYIKKTKSGLNISLSATPTGIENLNLRPDLLKQNYGQYKEGRKRWADKKNYKIISFMEYENIKNQSQHLIHISGFRYSKKGKQINLEKSYFVTCPKQTFHLKFMTLENSETGKELKSLEKALTISTCESMAKSL